MTQRVLASTLLVLCLACGKYGSPVRGGVSTAGSGAGVVLDHADGCDDPTHDHDEPPEPAPATEQTP